jgi:hypothetical protein
MPGYSLFVVYSTHYNDKATIYQTENFADHISEGELYSLAGRLKFS